MRKEVKYDPNSTTGVVDWVMAVKRYARAAGWSDTVYRRMLMVLWRRDNTAVRWAQTLSRYTRNNTTRLEKAFIEEWGPEELEEKSHGFVSTTQGRKIRCRRCFGRLGAVQRVDRWVYCL